MFAMIIHIINNICFGFLNSIGEKKIEDSNYNNQFVELAKGKIIYKFYLFY